LKNKETERTIVFGKNLKIKKHDDGKKTHQQQKEEKVGRKKGPM
jgi:hypothetical protein